ncbi:hypothetical protein FVE85_2454 [Porphyridium purpureum]|uniref:Mitochondrial ATPase complex subunit ATP10 n=1 Tax=Porphyridium purpureum TaxID=35688 RepID=A0A5J4YJ66_PORPP|nr:hypothetical protein FVE85_2454 [Porphyridium purpureum]|eukprot:POR4329..scf291_13
MLLRRGMRRLWARVGADGCQCGLAAVAPRNRALCHVGANLLQTLHAAQAERGVLVCAGAKRLREKGGVQAGSSAAGVHGAVRSRALSGEAKQASGEDEEKREGSGLKKMFFGVEKRTGYFDDLRELANDHDQKGFNQGPDIIPASEAPVIPRFKTTSLSTHRVVIQDDALKARANLVCVLFREGASEQVASWSVPFKKHVQFAPYGSAQVFQLIINESFVFQALSGWAQHRLRTMVPKEEHDFVLSFNDSNPELISLLAHKNRLYGHVLLLDRSARIRWRACGRASPETLSYLLNATDQLLQE